MNTPTPHPAEPVMTAHPTSPAPAAVPGLHPPPAGRRPAVSATALGCTRDFLGNRFVYAVVSPRARGLSIGVNLNPDKRCNFDCVYCEVDRSVPGTEKNLDVDVMAAELLATLARVHSGHLREHPAFANLPPELLTLRHVALSGDGEPTLCPNFAEALQAVVHVRALGKFPFFKIVLITNATGLDSPRMQGLKSLTKQDEIWVKLDAGSPTYFQRVNRPESGVTLDQVLGNILTLGRERAIIIQSLFPLVGDVEPKEDEIEAYSSRLKELKEAGANISLVQIYSATRPVARPDCSHLPLKSLSRIAQIVRIETGLTVEVF